MKPAKESLSPDIDSFLSMVTVEKGLSKNTIEAYSRDLTRLAGYLITHGISAWDEVKPGELRSYLSSLRAKGLNPRSIARHVVTLRRLFVFLETEGIVKKNPTPAILLTPGPRKLPQTLSSDDIRKLLAQPDAHEPLGGRDQAMFELLYASGLRVSELVGLRVHETNF